MAFAVGSAESFARRALRSGPGNSEHPLAGGIGRGRRKLRFKRLADDFIGAPPAFVRVGLDSFVRLAR